MISAEKVAPLEKLGYERRDAKAALLAANGDVSAATAALAKEFLSEKEVAALDREFRLGTEFPDSALNAARQRRWRDRKAYIEALEAAAPRPGVSERCKEGKCNVGDFVIGESKGEKTLFKIISTHRGKERRGRRWKKGPMARVKDLEGNSKAVFIDELELPKISAEVHRQLDLKFKEAGSLDDVSLRARVQRGDVAVSDISNKLAHSAQMNLVKKDLNALMSVPGWEDQVKIEAEKRAEQQMAEAMEGSAAYKKEDERRAKIRADKAGALKRGKEYQREREREARQPGDLQELEYSLPDLELYNLDDLEALDDRALALLELRAQRELLRHQPPPLE
tara:strand:+ start:208 stop:1218 length:1011 start_codon:yes stop_codon:yes gene_type:complete